jgi:hypothetical protein
MGKVFSSLLFIALFFTMCNEKDDPAGFSVLNENSYIFSVDRVALGPDVQFPRDTLQESAYVSTEEDIQYEVSFTDGGQNVSIKTGSSSIIRGEKTIDGKASKHYELNEGLFAGGRFIVWTNNNKEFEAEFTVYGSGVPIIRSERGKLTQQTN